MSGPPLKGVNFAHLKAHITDIWIYDQLRDAGIVYVLACSSAFTNYFVHLYSLIIYHFLTPPIRAFIFFIFRQERANLKINWSDKIIWIIKSKSAQNLYYVHPLLENNFISKSLPYFSETQDHFSKMMRIFGHSIIFLNLNLMPSSLSKIILFSICFSSEEINLLMSFVAECSWRSWRSIFLFLPPLIINKQGGTGDQVENFHLNWVIWLCFQCRIL